MIWIILSIVSYFMSAVVDTTDKFLLSSKTRDVLVYVFYVGILNGFAFMLWFFDFSFLPVKIMLFALAGGASFFLALIFFYSAMVKGEISRVASITGGISPLVLFVLSFLFLGERLPAFWLISLAVLILGGFLLSFEESKTGFKARKDVLFHSFAAAIFFASTFFFSKLVFSEVSFLNGFVWIRLSTFILSLVLLLSSSARRSLNMSPLKISKKLFFVFASNKGLGAAAFLLLNYAIMLGSATIANALQGVKYIFIFILTVFLSFFLPRFISESFSRRVILQKICGIFLISAGVAFLFVT